MSFKEDIFTSIAAEETPQDDAGTAARTGQNENRVMRSKKCQLEYMTPARTAAERK